MNKLSKAFASASAFSYLAGIRGVLLCYRLLFEGNSKATKPDVYVLMKTKDTMDTVIKKYEQRRYKQSSIEELEKLPASIMIKL
jgi:hypothetical protein